MGGGGLSINGFRSLDVKGRRFPALGFDVKGLGGLSLEVNGLRFTLRKSCWFDMFLNKTSLSFADKASGS